MQQAGRIAFIVSLVVAGFLIVWRAAHVFIVVFIGILLAVFLNATAIWIADRAPIDLRWARILALFVPILLIGLAALLIAPQVASQVDQLSEQLTFSLDSLRARISAHQWADWLLSRISVESLATGVTVTRGFGLLSGVLGAVTSLVVIIFIGVYCAMQPEVYQEGFLRLIPLSQRSRVTHALSELEKQMRHWILGRLVSMTVVGVLTTIGLFVIGMQLALVLGLLAGILAFVPYIGPVVAYVPALLLAFPEGGRMALYVTVVYLIVQALESYLITPLVQRRAVSLPPALQIAMQMLLGVLLGIGGIIIATPLTAGMIVLLRELGVGDIRQEAMTPKT